MNPNIIQCWQNSVKKPVSSVAHAQPPEVSDAPSQLTGSVLSSQRGGLPLVVHSGHTDCVQGLGEEVSDRGAGP